MLIDAKTINVGHDLTDIGHNGSTIFLGNAKIPYTPRAWEKLKSMRDLTGAIFLGHLCLMDWKVADQQRLISDWLNEAPRPILKK